MLLSLFLFGLLILVLFFWFRVEIDFRIWGDERDHLGINLYIGPLGVPLLGITRWLLQKISAHFSIMIHKYDQEDSVSFLGKLQKVLGDLTSQGKLLFIATYLIVQRITRLKLRIDFSLGDPGMTAVSVGTIWASISPVLVLLQSYSRLSCMPDININPTWDKSEFRGELYCIFGFQIGQIIINIVRMLGESLVRRMRAKEM